VNVFEIDRVLENIETPAKLTLGGDHEPVTLWAADHISLFIQQDTVGISRLVAAVAGNRDGVHLE